MKIEQLNPEQVREMLLSAAKTIVEKESYLTEIDVKIGDGDHGIGMALGFQGILNQLPLTNPDTVEKVLEEAGRILLDTMGGASGVLFGTLFISGVIGRTSSPVYGLQDFADTFRTSLEAIKARGRARVGDKTMVDALEPAVAALEEGADKGLDIKEGFALAAAGAKKGMEYTKEIKARFGRAKYYGEKAIGLQDAGATSVWLIFQAMSDWVSSKLI